MFVRETGFRILEESEKELIKLVNRYAAQTLKFPSVLRCELMGLKDMPTSFVLHEAFKDEESHDVHMGRRQTSVFRFELKELAQDELETRLLELAEHGNYQRRAVRQKSAWETVANARSQDLNRKEPFVWVRSKLTRVEFAAATDGPFRGLPDPALVVALYRLEEAKVTLAGRLLWRVTMPREAPYVAHPAEAVLEVPCSIRTFPARFVVLVVGVEENGGRGVQEAYQRLEAAEHVMLSKLSQDEAPTSTLGEFSCAEAHPSQGLNVLPIVEGAPLTELMHNDTWVGASAAVVELMSIKLEDVQQFRLCTDATQNDWLATLCLSMGTGMG